MRIAIFHELHLGGARRAVNEFAKRLKIDNIVDLYIIDNENRYEEKDYFTNVFFIKFIPKKWSGNNWKLKLYKDTIELYKLYRLHKEVADNINSKKYDVAFIHPSQYTQAPFILRFIQTKKIYYCQEPLRIAYESIFDISPNANLIKNIYEKLTRRTRKRIDKTNISRADLILANSQNTQKNIWLAYHKKSIVSYLGVDIDTFKPFNLKTDIDILFIGASDNIDGLALLKKAILLMKKKPILKTQISGKGWISSDKEFRKLYLRSKIVVCLARNEPFGLIPLEAMACGIPVVAINEGGYKETIINGKTGFLIPGSARILAQKLDYLLTHKKIRQKSSNKRSYNTK